jgi:hypothetical protein
MNPIVQSGMHPDAESLTAFAEQLLPAEERDQILAHMATCGRCREVVFLAQHAAEEEQPAAVSAIAEVPAAPRTSWFTGWRWAWIPAVALAGFVGFAVVQHFRHPATETQLSAKLSPADNLRQPPNALPAAPAPIPQSSEELKQAKKAKPSEGRDDASSRTRTEKDVEKQLDEKKSPARREFATGAIAGLAGGSMHGMMTARANSGSVGGPVAANQFQQQNLAPNVAQQNMLQQSQSVAADSLNKPVTAGAAPASATQTVTVQADTVEMSAAPAQTPAPQVSSLPLTGQTYEVSSAKVTALDKAQKITLPGGLGTLSVASEASRSIALDTAGAMFLSVDGGKHWQPIQTQWTGRALLVRTRPVGTQAAALRAPQTMRFELVNDKLQTWISYDGKTWTQQPIPLQ